MSAREPFFAGDPLAKLYRQLERLRGAAGRGEDVGRDIQQVEQSIGEMVKGREEQEAARQRAHEREQDGGRHR